jgi:hypothetical protein
MFMLSCVLLSSCKSSSGIKAKPDWVQNRPTNELYYVGVGIASKANNPFDYQQVAKKNAVNDLISEIKVMVSSNSVLSQFQHNKEFSQQFESDVKVTAVNTIEQFNVIDSWEDKDFFWIYYRLSKDEFKSAQLRKMQLAVEQAENYLTIAESFDKDQLMQSIRLKIKALAALQLYLNEDLKTSYNGRDIYLVNELVNSIQKQLYQIELVSSTTILQGKIGKPIAEPFTVQARYRTDQSAVPYLPVTLFSEQNPVEGTRSTETDQKGIASIAITKIIDKAPVQVVRIKVDIKTMIRVDSLNQTLQTILESMDVPSTSIRLNISPLKIYITSTERNLSRALEANYIENALKNKLSMEGCSFVPVPETADYILTIDANTKAEGIIWGNMKTASLNMNISLVDCSQHMEIYKNSLREIKGFQTTDINAGINAYNNAIEQLFRTIYPTLKSELIKGN